MCSVRRKWPGVSLSSSRTPVASARVGCPGARRSDTTRVSLSYRDGTGVLWGRFFGINQGCSTIQREPESVSDPDVHTSPVERLDAFDLELGVGVMKMDIEGHELDAMRGAPISFPEVVSETSCSRNPAFRPHP